MAIKQIIEKITNMFKKKKIENFGNQNHVEDDVCLDYEILELLYMMDDYYFYKIKYSDGSTDVKKFDKEMETVTV